MYNGENITIKLVGPDTKHGAEKRSRLKAYKFIAVWYASGKRKIRSTGVKYDPRNPRAEQEKQARLAFMVEYSSPEAETNVNGALLITSALTLYGKGHIAHKQNKDFPIKARYLIEHFKGVYTDALSEDVLRSYVNWRCEVSKAQPQTVRGDIEFLQAAINWCVDNGKLSAYRVKLWKPDKATAREVWYTRDQVAALIRAARQEKKSRRHLALFIFISVFTGQRSKHVLSLQWEPNPNGGHVDIEKGVINFLPQGKAQSAKKAAQMPIPKSLRPLLKRLHANKEKYVISYKGRKVGTVLKSFKNAAKRAGVEGSPHSLRHTAITWMLLNGLTPWQVSKYVSVTVDTIVRTYGHVADAQMQQLAERI